jgi:hypothetical protein
MPNDTDKARLIQKFCIPENKIVPKLTRRRTQSIRSTGYIILFFIILYS